MKQANNIRNKYFSKLKLDWIPFSKLSFSTEAEEVSDDSAKERLFPYLQQHRIGTAIVPSLLERKLHSVLKGTSKVNLREEADLLIERKASLFSKSNSPQKKGNKEKNQIKNMNNTTFKQQGLEELKKMKIGYDRTQSLAYLAHIMPGNYGPTVRIFSEIKRILNDKYSPSSILDFGTGPGTAIWAALDTWSVDDLSISQVDIKSENQVSNQNENKNLSNSQIITNTKRILAVEPSTAMMDIANSIFKGTKIEKQIEWRRYLHVLPENSSGYDLVTANYAISEFSEKDERTETIKNLWSSVNDRGIFVILESGNQHGFSIINEAREFFLQMKSSEAPNFQIIAPCPHSDKCPIAAKGDDSVCNFTQRTRKIQIHGSKGIGENWIDIPFSYLVLRKVSPKSSLSPTSQASEADIELKIQEGEWDKIIKHPMKRGKHVVIDVCSQDGTLKRKIVSKSMGTDIYKAARKSSWGDSFSSNK